MYVSRLGFEAISLCAASHQEVLSITDSINIILNNIITAYSNEKIQQKRNCTATTKTFAEELYCRRIFPSFSASATPSSSSLMLSRVSGDGTLFSTDLQDLYQIHVLENIYDFPTSLPLTLSPDDNKILLHLLYSKKLAIEYYHDSKRIFIETYLCSESESDIIDSNRVIRNDKIDASASRVKCIEIIAVQTLPGNSH